MDTARAKSILGAAEEHSRVLQGLIASLERIQEQGGKS
jgi:hypothetical protein